MKKLLYVLVIAIVLCVSLAVTSFASTVVESGSCGTSVTYTLDSDGLLTISGSGAMTSSPWSSSSVKAVVIESGVTGIVSYAFENCTAIEDVIIPDSVTSVGYCAFQGCTNLKSIYIGKGLNGIAVSCFNRCDSLEMIVVDADNRKLSSDENGILYNKNKTTLTFCPRARSTATISDSVTTINASAFNGCRNLTSIVIPEGVTTIGGNAFENCDKLASVVMYDNVTSIGQSAFRDCVSLTDISISDSVTYINDYLFRGCTSLVNVELPDSLTKIYNYAFYGCTSLERVAIPDGVTSIGNSAFAECTALKKLSLPDSVTEVKEYAFSGCRAITRAYLSDKLTSISQGAFMNCTKLASVNIPESVTSIGAQAFYECEGLISVIVPEGVTSIGSYALGYYSYDYEYKFERIEGFTVYGREGSAAEDYAKSNGIAFDVIENAPDNTVFGTVGALNWEIADGVLVISGEGELPDYTKTVTAPWYEYKSQITSIVVENGVTAIGNYAFYNLTKATSVTVAESVKYVGIQFIRQTAVTEISLPGVVNIEKNAFGRADSLKSIILGESFANARGNLFYSEAVTIKAPENSYAHKYAEFFEEKYGEKSEATVTFESDGTTAKSPVAEFGTMGDNVFYAMYENAKGNWKMVISGIDDMKNYPYVCTKNELKGYTFCPTHYLSEEGKVTKVLSLEVLDGVTTLGNYAFYKCTKATSVILPDSITSVGQGAFRTCPRLTSITLPETVTKIEANAFNGCAALTSVNIPDAVTEIGKDIFVKCNTSVLTVRTDNELAIKYLNDYYPEITVE
ncbi:MAG: leucine-rich repeat domain-containing protein [Clostridia bacterium]|nr:leucine-rich repeat domain-containing protein [Clostridia bacterium]